MNDPLRIHCGSRGYTLSRFINVNNISIYGTKKMKSEECYHSPTIFYPKAVYKSVSHINVILIYSFLGVFREELDLNDNLKTIEQCLFVTLIRYHKTKKPPAFLPYGNMYALMAVFFATVTQGLREGGCEGVTRNFWNGCTVPLEFAHVRKGILRNSLRNLN